MRLTPLAKGQVWQTKAANIEIVGVGKRLVHYRIIRQLRPRRLSAQISGIGPMENYLKTNKATLATGPVTPGSKRLSRPRIQSNSKFVMGSREILMEVGANECSTTTLSACAA